MLSQMFELYPSYSKSFVFSSDKTKVWYRDEQHQSKLWFEVGTQVVGFKAFDTLSQAGMQQPHDATIHWCQFDYVFDVKMLQLIDLPLVLTGSNQCTDDNGSCQHLCLAVPGGRTCSCGHDHVLVNTTHCSPVQQCPAGTRLCLDQHTCQPTASCNDHVDCSEHLEEICESVNALNRNCVIHLSSLYFNSFFVLMTFIS